MHRRRSGRPLGVGLARYGVAAFALFATAAGAQAACISAAFYDYEEFTKGQRIALQKLRYETPVKLCLTSAGSGFVQILDTPSSGDPQVLYPSKPSEADPKNAEYAPITGNQELCLGGDFSDDFVLFQPKSEGPSGTLAITVTLTEDKQLPANQWVIPGRAEEHLGSHKEGGNRCSGRDILYIDYKVE